MQNACDPLRTLFAQPVWADQINPISEETMASFYRTGTGLIHEDAFESDACPTPESRRTYNGIEDLEPGDRVHDGDEMITVTAEMIATAKAEKANS